MRILMTTMQLDIGGAETHIVELSKALSRRGIEVVVASNGGAYEAELTEAGIKHIRVPFHSKKPSCMYNAYKLLKQIIQEYRFDVVHAHARIPAFLCALLKKKLNFRLVTTAHWVFSTRFPYNLLTRWGDRSLAVSDDIKNYLVENYGLEPDNIRVTINGIDLEKFSKDTDFSSVAEEFELLPDKTRIVYVSRMDIDRSLAAHKLIEAVPDLAGEIPNLEVVIVGGGNDLSAIEEEAMAVNSALGYRAIITTGSRTDINRFAACGQLFIGVSRAALEAMACEKPAIIAGNEGYIGIFDEDKLSVSIDTNFCCRGCQPTETDKLKEDILSILKSSPERQAELGEFSRETVRKYYSIDTMADDALKMYISIVKGTPINQADISELDTLSPYLAKNPLKLTGRKIDVMISGYYGFHNSGDDSILKAIVDSLIKERPSLRILALSNNPDETRDVYNIEAIHRFNLFKILWYMSKTRLLISGGGSLIQDVTSNKSLFYYLGIISIGRMMGARIMLYANGIGPVNRQKNYGIIRSVLNKVDLITLREPSSLDELEKFGVKEPEIRVTADPAFILAPEDCSALLKNCGIPEEKPYCGIALRPWKYADKNFEKLIADTADYIKKTYNIEILFIPMQEEKDISISQKVIALMKQTGYLIEGKPSPAQLLSLVGGAEFIMGMRLHTLIYAAKMGTPVIGLSYDPKVDATMSYLGQNRIESVRSINPLTMQRYIDEIIADCDKLKKQLTVSGRESEKKAAQNTYLALNLLDRKV